MPGWGPKHGGAQNFMTPVVLANPKIKVECCKSISLIIDKEERDCMVRLMFAVILVLLTCHGQVEGKLD